MTALQNPDSELITQKSSAKVKFTDVPSSGKTWSVLPRTEEKGNKTDPVVSRIDVPFGCATESTMEGEVKTLAHGMCKKCLDIARSRKSDCHLGLLDFIVETFLSQELLHVLAEEDAVAMETPPEDFYNTVLLPWLHESSSDNTRAMILRIMFNVLKLVPPETFVTSLNDLLQVGNIIPGTRKVRF